MTTQMRLRKDSNSNVTYGIAFSNTGSYTTLAASTEQTLTVPQEVTDALFQYSVGTNVFVDVGSTPLSLPGGIFTSTTADLNPIIRQVTPGETLRFISDTPAYVKVSFYNTDRPSY
ncbi:MAG: hypothetical protein GWN62_31355 [Aliifodinibius sp.]|nr:hypothetical protein [Fodinibius sp.]